VGSSHSDSLKTLYRMKNAPVGHIAGANFFRMADYNMCVLIIGQVTLPAHKKKKYRGAK